MRSAMRQWLIVTVLLINAIQVFASYDNTSVLVCVANHMQPAGIPYHSRVSSSLEASEDEGSAGSSEITSPIMKSKDITREDSCDSFVLVVQPLSDCGTRISSNDVSDCGTRISDDKPDKDKSKSGKDMLASSLMKSITSRGSLTEFFDKDGNPIHFDPSTPLTARGENSRGENSPLRSTLSRRFGSLIGSPKK